MEYVQTLKTPTEIQINASEPVNQNFEELVIYSIDQAFSILGERSKQSIYFLLESEYKLCRTNIPDRTGDFANAIEEIFGISALLIEIQVMKTLRQRVPLFTYIIENAELNFDEYLSSLRSFMNTHLAF
jgi:hypothetical protein